MFAAPYRKMVGSKARLLLNADGKVEKVLNLDEWLNNLKAGAQGAAIEMISAQFNEAYLRQMAEFGRDLLQLRSTLVIRGRSRLNSGRALGNDCHGHAGHSRRYGRARRPDVRRHEKRGRVQRQWRRAAGWPDGDEQRLNRARQTSLASRGSILNWAPWWNRCPTSSCT